jgi:beta-glucosidase/6-phospho-beta-glucosidase/beta-galactosidase
VGYFETFARDVVKEFAADVDLWITINEPSAYLLLGHVAGMWPPGRTFTASTFLNLPGMQGPYAEAFDNMVNAHKRVYQAIHEIDKTVASPKLPNPAPAKVGIAHIGMVSHANSTLDVPSKLFFENLSKYGLLDNIANEMDFIGLNYYGAEFVKGTGVEIRDDKEYSESGRAIYPEGIFHILNDFNKRYNISHKNRTADASGKFRVIPFIITENGIADASDILRPAYTVEHLLAVHHAIQKGIPVEGYVAWTTSDNWEWLDGYCPKFGFAAVDRKNGFQRKLRDSFFLFQKIVAKGIITQGHRESAWEVVRENVGKPRPFCRAADGKSSLDVPTTRDIVDVDWRFRPPE